MPEGPEVRRYAGQLHAGLAGQRIFALTARTRAARAWLAEHDGAFDGRRVERVCSRGKNLIGYVEGGYYFYSHLMMWGRWQVVTDPEPVPVDRRERARITVPEAQAILLSAPVFEVGQGDPFERVEYLASLGPDVLPYPGDTFDGAEFLKRLLAPEQRERAIGAVLLDQRVAAGIGNYLRAEMLFACRLDPFRRVADLNEDDLQCLLRTIPEIAARAYATGGVTVPDDQRERMRGDARLVYRPESEWGNRHFVFRRTNLPCLVCGDTIRQLRQVTYQDDEGERERIIYFCPTCQGTSVPLKPIRVRRTPASMTAAESVAA